LEKRATLGVPTADPSGFLTLVGEVDDSADV
jgi:hypothetical protein